MSFLIVISANVMAFPHQPWNLCGRKTRMVALAVLCQVVLRTSLGLPRSVFGIISMLNMPICKMKPTASFNVTCVQWNFLQEACWLATEITNMKPILDSNVQFVPKDYQATSLWSSTWLNTLVKNPLLVNFVATVQLLNQ